MKLCSRRPPDEYWDWVPVGVAVVDPAGYLAPMRLANDNGSTAGVYPVGSITIT